MTSIDYSGGHVQWKKGEEIEKSAKPEREKENVGSECVMVCVAMVNGAERRICLRGSGYTWSAVPMVSPCFHLLCQCVRFSKLGVEYCSPVTL